MKLNKAIIAWNSKYATGKLKPGQKSGALAVIAFPPTQQQVDQYSEMTGACESRFRDLSKDASGLFVSQIALKLIFQEGFDAREVLETLEEIDEFRVAMPPEVREQLKCMRFLKAA